MGSKKKVVFENRVIYKKGIEVNVEELSADEKREAAAWWYESFMREMGYIRKKDRA